MSLCYETASVSVVGLTSYTTHIDDDAILRTTVWTIQVSNGSDAWVKDGAKFLRAWSSAEIESYISILSKRSSTTSNNTLRHTDSDVPLAQGRCLVC